MVKVIKDLIPVKGFAKKLDILLNKSMKGMLSKTKSAILIIFNKNFLSKYALKF